jgi:hypothetical protein
MMGEDPFPNFFFNYHFYTSIFEGGVVLKHHSPFFIVPLNSLRGFLFKIKKEILFHAKPACKLTPIFLIRKGFYD